MGCSSEQLCVKNKLPINGECYFLPEIEFGAAMTCDGLALTIDGQLPLQDSKQHRKPHSVMVLTQQQEPTQSTTVFTTHKHTTSSIVMCWDST